MFCHRHPHRGSKVPSALKGTPGPGTGRESQEAGFRAGTGPGPARAGRVWPKPQGWKYPSLGPVSASRQRGLAPDMPLDRSLITSLMAFDVRNKFKKNALKLVASALSAVDVAELRVAVQ